MLEHFTQDSQAGPLFRVSFACNLLCSVGKEQPTKPARVLTVAGFRPKASALNGRATTCVQQTESISRKGAQRHSSPALKPGVQARHCMNGEV